jgi:hypothetical protein
MGPSELQMNGVLAYSQLLGHFPSYAYGEVFTFDSNYLQWNYDNLPLDCTARLEWKRLEGHGARPDEHGLRRQPVAVTRH